LHNGGAAGKAQTRMHGAAKKAHKDPSAQRGGKQGKVQEPQQADEGTVRGVRRLS